MLECVVNVSEGRDAQVLAALATAGGGAVLDVHSDAWHHRSVLTLAGPDVERAARRVAAVAVATIDLARHDGVHPRLGAVDVVPFVPLHGTAPAAAVAARDAFAAWLAEALGVPSFLYGPERTLPDVRRSAFRSAAPDVGPSTPHPTAGACAAGARPVLVAWNVWLAPGVEVAMARRVAASLRSPEVRALGLDVGGRAQVSCNLVDPLHVGPGAVFDRVVEAVDVDRCELVGLAPAAVVEAEPPDRRELLDLSPARTIEARLREAGLD